MYEALETFLRATPHHIPEITLSFEQIELIIGNALPASHLDYPQWWENQSDTANRPQARAWTNAGFMVRHFNQDRTDGWVTFARR